MRRLLVAVTVAVAALSLAAPASAWPPVCKPIVYDTLGICV